MLTNAQKINLTLRAVLEFGIVIALGIWGYHSGTTGATSIVFLILFPIVGFGIWGSVDFSQFEQTGEYFRLVEELIISLLAAYGLYTSGQVAFSVFMASLTLIYHLLVYVTGERLLKQT